MKKIELHFDRRNYESMLGRYNKKSEAKKLIKTETDPNKIEQYKSYLLGHKSLRKPTIKQYTLYVETDRELRRYNACLTIIKGIEAAGNYTDLSCGVLNPKQILRAYSPMLLYNDDTRKYTPNYLFVKYFNPMTW